MVRFSIYDPDSTHWRANKSGLFSSAKEYRDYLWSEERLGLRLRIFGDLAAPIYDEIADRHDFRVLVQHSRGLPRPWIGALRELAAEHPWLRLAPVKGQTEARDSVAADLAGNGRVGTVVMLRVDDDDLLSVDFVDQLLPHTGPEHHGWVLSLGRGYAARWGRDGPVDFRELVWPFSSIGQAYVGSYSAKAQHLGMGRLLSHRLVHLSVPTVVDSRSAAFVQVRHTESDTTVGADRERAQRALQRGMRKLPPVEDFDTLRRLFPTLGAAADRAQQAWAARATRPSSWSEDGIDGAGWVEKLRSGSRVPRSVTHME